MARSQCLLTPLSFSSSESRQDLREVLREGSSGLASAPANQAGHTIWLRPDCMPKFQRVSNLDCLEALSTVYLAVTAKQWSSSLWNTDLEPLTSAMSWPLSYHSILRRFLRPPSHTLCEAFSTVLWPQHQTRAWLPLLCRGEGLAVSSLG